MTSLNHLLAATDFSSSSLHAVDRGFLIAGSTRARYTVLHALGLEALAGVREFLSMDSAAVAMRITDEARETLTGIVGDSSRNRGLSAHVQVEPEMAGWAVPAYAEANGVDLILLGAHGKGFLQRFLLGSTASRLLRKSPCPVLMVKEACRAPYRRALVAVDFSPASELSIRLAREVAPGADVVLLHVFDVPFEGQLRYAGVGEDAIHRYRIEARERGLRQLHDMARVAGVSGTDCTTRVLHGDATRQILFEEENSDCDLIVIGKHGTHVTEELLLGSVTNRVLAESRSDVLVVLDKRV